VHTTFIIVVGFSVVVVIISSLLICSHEKNRKIQEIEEELKKSIETTEAYRAELKQQNRR
jgi:uncharacterized membrane-anchored protein YhcB (DUF1043 family)